jgi:hypothetical protein
LPSFPGIADTAEIGQILADRRGWLFFNLDDEIERHYVHRAAPVPPPPSTPG